MQEIIACSFMDNSCSHTLSEQVTQPTRLQIKHPQTYVNTNKQES